MTIITLAALAAAVAGAVAPVPHDAPRPAQSVRYNPDDLKTIAGREAVRRRIGWAVFNVCDEMQRGGAMPSPTETRACRAEATQAAMRDLDVAIAAANPSIDALAAR